MGNREKLLAGAKASLRERGYARTTARHVVAASGANLASIGYHFGSMEALLTAAMIEGVGDFGESFERVLAEEGAIDLATIWSRIVDSFGEHRAILMASFEAFVQSEHLPELRAQLAAAYEGAREGLAPLFLGAQGLPGLDGPSDPAAARAVGSVSVAMLTGIMTQWLTDPDAAPTGEEVAVALRLLGARAAREAAG